MKMNKPRYLPKKVSSITQKNLGATRRYLSKNNTIVKKIIGDLEELILKNNFIVRVSTKNELLYRNSFYSMSEDLKNIKRSEITQNLKYYITKHVRGNNGKKYGEDDLMLSFSNKISEIATWIYLCKKIGYCQIVICKNDNTVFYKAEDYIDSALLKNWSKSSSEYITIGEIPKSCIYKILTL
jgi:hypothetical protein